MFGWLKKKDKVPETLYFKSNEAAFEYASEYMTRPLVINSIIFGLVISDVKSTSSQEKWRVKLATEHGVFEVDHCGSIAEESIRGAKESSPIQSGDLVAVQVAAYDPTYPVTSPIQYFIIMLQLKPELNAEKHIFVPEFTANK